MENTMRMVGTRNRGYTIIEVVVIIAIAAVVTTVAFLMAGGDKPAKFGQDFDALAAALRGLQSDARAAKGNDEYGMCFQAGGWMSFSIPSGSTEDPCAPGFAGRIESKDFRVATMDVTVVPAADRIVFERVTGHTENDAVATLTLTLDDPARTRTLKVEPSGAVHEE